MDWKEVFKEHLPKESKREKLRLKLPMRNEVIDIKNQWWRYYFIDGRIQWVKLGSVYFEE